MFTAAFYNFIIILTTSFIISCLIIIFFLSWFCLFLVFFTLNRLRAAFMVLNLPLIAVQMRPSHRQWALFHRQPQFKLVVLLPSDCVKSFVMDSASDYLSVHFKRPRFGVSQKGFKHSGDVTLKVKEKWQMFLYHSRKQHSLNVLASNDYFSSLMIRMCM